MQVPLPTAAVPDLVSAQRVPSRIAALRSRRRRQRLRTWGIRLGLVTCGAWVVIVLVIGLGP